MREVRANAWIAAVVSGVLQVLVFPTPNLFFLCWIAYAPLLLAVLGARWPSTLQLPATLAPQSEPATPWQAFLLGWIAGTIWSFGSCYWIYHVMNSYGGLAPPVAFGVLVLFSFYIGLYEAIFALLLALIAGPRGWSRRALLLAPFLWVAIELFRARIVGFPWDLLGTAQVDNIPLALISRSTGVYGVSFEIMLVNAAFASAFLLGLRSRRALLISTALVAVAVQCGVFFNPSPTVPVAAPGAPPFKIARLVQQNVPILDNWSPDYFQTTLRSMADLSLTAHAQLSVRANGVRKWAEVTPPSVIIWPESPAPYYLNDPVFRNAVADLARRATAYVIVGSVGTGQPEGLNGAPGAIYNSAALITPGGEWTSRYDKIHLVPFGEYVPYQELFGFAHQLTREVGQFSRGTTRNTFDLGSYDAGVFICYESIFPGEVRQFAVNGAQVFVNISNDGWFGETAAPYQHLNQARMRAIENDRWLLRCTNTGITASIDPFGRVIARAPRNVRTAIDVPFGISGRTTFYTRYGDWFPYSCAIISFAAILLRRISKRVL